MKPRIQFGKPHPATAGVGAGLMIVCITSMILAPSMADVFLIFNSIILLLFFSLGSKDTKSTHCSAQVNKQT